MSGDPLHDRARLDEEAWPPRRYCTECDGWHASTPLTQRPARTVATFVATHISGMQWYACDKHRLSPSGWCVPNLHDTRTIRFTPIKEWWEKIAADDAAKRLDGTWRPV